MSLQALLEACIEDLEYNVSLWSVTRSRALECGRALAACRGGAISIREGDAPRATVETSRGDLVGVVRETMQPAHATLWLRSDTASSKKVEVSG